jgi:hypothetical protein
MLAELRKVDSKAKLPGWVIHDLRRTARSLMSRAGVPPRHAEMALGHVVAGVEGVYDRHRYLDEKQQAFEALAAQIDRILNPQDNVIPNERRCAMKMMQPLTCMPRSRRALPVDLRKVVPGKS